MLRQLTPIRNEVLEPIVDTGEVSGFQSPARDYEDNRLNIIQRLINDPMNTYFFEAVNDDMDLFHIVKGSVLVVDRTINPRGGMLIVLWHDGEWKCRQLIVHGKKRYITTGKEKDEFIEVTNNSEVVVFGVITWNCNPQAENCKSML